MNYNFKELFSSLKGNLLILVLSMFMWTFTQQMIQTYEPLYIFSLGGTGTVLGLILAIQTIFGMFLRILGGYMADIYGRKRIIGVFTAISSFAYLFYVFAEDWTWIVVGASLASVTSLFGPALEAIRADSIKPEERGRGYMLLNTLPRIPAIIAPAIGGMLILNRASEYGIEFGNLKIVYFLLFLGVFLSGIIRLLFLKETLTPSKKRQKPSINVFKEIYETVTNCDPYIRRLFILIGFFMFCFHFEARLRAIYAISVKGLSTAEWGQIVTVSQAVSIIAIFVIGWLIDSYSRKKIFIPSIAFLGVAAFLFTISSTFTSFLISMTITAICQQARIMALTVLIADSTPRNVRGRIFSLINILGSLGSSTSVLLSGILYDLNQTLPFYIATIMYLLATLIAIKFLQEAKIRHI